MSYNKRVNWKDHSVERPRTYKEAANGDGTNTYTPSFGEVLQQGTPQSATNFNKMDEALQHISIAYDMLLTTVFAELRDARKRIAALEEKTKSLGG